MSFDLKLARKCDHRLFRQIRFFETDLRTVRLPTVIGATQNFEVFLNGTKVLKDSEQAGWELVKDDTSISPAQRKLVFKKPRRAEDDWVELSYFTSPRSCPKCSGFDLFFDYTYSNLGRPLRVTNENKLIQGMEKIILTVRGSSIYYPWYGTLLVSLLGAKQPNSVLKLRMQREIAEALDNLKSLQEQQELYQNVSDREFLFQIEGISVVETEDPTLFQVFVRARTQAGGSAEFKRPLRFDKGFFTTEQKLISARAAF